MEPPGPRGDHKTHVAKQMRAINREGGVEDRQAAPNASREGGGLFVGGIDLWLGFGRLRRGAVGRGVCSRLFFY